MRATQTRPAKGQGDPRARGVALQGEQGQGQHRQDQLGKVFHTPETSTATEIRAPEFPQDPSI